MDKNFTIRCARPEDVATLRVLVPDVFIRKDAMSLHLQTSAEEFASIYDELTRCLDFNTSMVATTPSGEVAACFLTAPYDAPFDSSTLHPAILPIKAVVDCLDSWFEEEFKHVSQTKTLHYLFGATKAEFEGRGLNKRLCAAGLERAQTLGWKMVVVECVTPVTQHVMRDIYRFTVGKEVVYEEVEHQGTRPFQGLEGSAMLLYKVFD